MQYKLQLLIEIIGFQWRNYSVSDNIKHSSRSPVNPFSAVRPYSYRVSRQCSVASWRGRRGSKGGNCPLNFRRSENCLQSANFLPKRPNLGLKYPFWGEFRGKIELLSTHNLRCRKSSPVRRKIACFLPTPNCLNARRWLLTMSLGQCGSADIARR